MEPQVDRSRQVGTLDNQPQCEVPNRKAPALHAEDRPRGARAMALHAEDRPRGARAMFGQSAECQIIRDTFALLGDKWSLLIVRILAEGTFRFGELKRIVVGISQRMLTLTLRNLERDGLVSRTVYPEVPPRVEYQLTALGRTLIEPVSALSAWALTHHGQIERHRASAQE